MNHLVRHDPIVTISGKVIESGVCPENNINVRTVIPGRSPCSDAAALAHMDRDIDVFNRELGIVDIDCFRGASDPIQSELAQCGRGCGVESDVQSPTANLKLSRVLTRTVRRKSECPHQNQARPKSNSREP